MDKHIFPTTSINQFTRPAQRYGLDLRSSKHNQSKSSLPEISRFDTTFDRTTTETTIDLTISIRHLARKRATNPKSMLAAIFKPDHKPKTSHPKLPVQSHQSAQYDLTQHLHTQSQSSVNLGKLADKLKTVQRDAFQSSNPSAKVLFNLMQGHTLRYQRRGDDVGPQILKQIDASGKQFVKRGNSNSPKHVEQMTPPPPSPTASEAHNYNVSVRRRLSRVSSQDHMQLFNQLKLSYLSKDPLEMQRLEQIKYFFNDLRRNLENVMKHGSIKNINGCTPQIKELLLNESKEALYDQYLRIDGIDQTHDLRELVDSIESSPLYRKLHYFNNSLLTSIRKRLHDKLEMSLTRKLKLQAMIQDQQRRLRNQADAALCTPLPLPPVHRVAAIPQMPTLDKLKCEMLDRNIHETYCLRIHDHN